MPASGSPIAGRSRGCFASRNLIERPGLRLDFVARQEVPIFGARTELRFEARNLTGQDYEEFQEIDGNRVDINSYEVGRSFSLGITVHF